MFSSRMHKGTGERVVTKSRGFAEVMLHGFVLKYVQMSSVADVM